MRHATVIVLNNKTILDPATIVLVPVILTANLPAAFHHYNKANRQLYKVTLLGKELPVATGAGHHKFQNQGNVLTSGVDC